MTDKTNELLGQFKSVIEKKQSTDEDGAAPSQIMENFNNELGKPKPKPEHTNQTHKDVHSDYHSQRPPKNNNFKIK